MMQFMRKATKSSTSSKRSQRKRSQVDAKPPNYYVSAAQAEVQLSDELREAAAEIVKQLDERESSEPDQAVEQSTTAEHSPGSTFEFAATGNEDDRRVGRSKANPRVIHLKI